MPKKFKQMSRQHQKFLYSLIINNYASYLQGLDKNPVSMGDNVYWTAKAKHELKKLYIKSTKDIREEKPLDAFNDKLKDVLREIIPKTYTLDAKIEIISEDIQYNLRDFLSDLAIELGRDEYFSLALRSCSNEKAIAFTRFCIDYYVDNEIPIDQVLRDSILETEAEHYTIACIKKRVCIITGKQGADIHHVEHVGTMGYKRKDAGDLLVLPLCRDWHDQVDYKGDKWILEQYHLTPVPHKLALGSYTEEEIRREIENHKNPNKTTIIKKGG